MVVLGTGWAAVSALKTLFKRVAQGDCTLPHVTVISPRNYFMFTPLLPMVAVGTVEANSLCANIREFSFSNLFRYIEAHVVDVDVADNKVSFAPITSAHGSVQPTLPLPSALEIPYDTLVVAVGAQNNTFGTPGVNEHCLFMKEIGDGIALRKRILANLEAGADFEHFGCCFRRFVSCSLNFLTLHTQRVFRPRRKRNGASCCALLCAAAALPALKSPRKSLIF